MLSARKHAHGAITRQTLPVMYLLKNTDMSVVYGALHFATYGSSREEHNRMKKVGKSQATPPGLRSTSMGGGDRLYAEFRRYDRARPLPRRNGCTSHTESREIRRGILKRSVGKAHRRTISDPYLTLFYSSRTRLNKLSVKSHRCRQERPRYFVTTIEKLQSELGAKPAASTALERGVLARRKRGPRPYAFDGLTELFAEQGLNITPPSCTMLLYFTLRTSRS
ncbi:hypothetical protein EVAR_55392_1 [Eumeta japonica]|uniref:Uncharacterized protein n=1 Tax=Eumeta variegata TaxID=151549 RepID=A0A4C1YNK3_EUMVA|nr:hypothetical protein EVAR_55392_1 [Eumeta japonica]